MLSIRTAKGDLPMTAYLIHSLPLLMSAVQIFCGEKMAVVAHLAGLDQLGYETELGLNLAVSNTIHEVYRCNVNYTFLR